MYIKRIEFRNCQALRNATYDLAPGLNVIVAPDNDGNSTGKSVFFKCLRTAINSGFFEPSELVHLISYGERVASALFTLSDGSAGGFLAVERRVIYLYRQDENSDIERLTLPHPEFLHKMSIIMDAKTKFVLNILDAEQEMLFVTSREDTNFSILKLVSDNEVLEDAVLRIEDDLVDVRELHGKAVVINAELQRKLRSMETADMLRLKQQVEYGNEMLPCLHSLADIVENLSRIKSKTFPNFEEATELLQLCGTLEKLSGLLNGVKRVSDVNFKEMLEICDGWAALARICDNVAQYDANRLRIVNLNQELDCVLSEMKTLAQVVDCPVRGRVLFAEDGCVEIGGEEG